MKPVALPIPLTRCPIPLLLVLFLCGCLPTERVVWSPDGSQAAVFADDGLRLCDRDGTISELLIPDAYLGAWLNEGSRLVIALGVETRSWTDLSSLLSDSQIAGVTAQAQLVQTRVRTPEDWKTVKADMDEKKHHVEAVLLYLRDRVGADFLKLIGDGAAAFQDLSASVSRLQTMQWHDGRMHTLKVLAHDLHRAADIRPAPDGRAVAYSTVGDEGDPTRLYVVLTDGSRPAQRVAEPAAIYPDWADHGRVLIYIRSLATQEPDAISLGVLARRAVWTDDGSFELAEEVAEKVGLLFNETARVRCLKDGRVLFSAFEVQLPITENDFNEIQQLFMIDPNRTASLIRLIPRGVRTQLPEDLSFFQVSPDETRLLIAGTRGDVSVVTIASGEVTRLQEKHPDDHALLSVPTWRADGAATFVSFVIDEEEAKQNPPQVKLLLPGQKLEDAATLSLRWPDDARKGFLD